jgi:CSLREA domain-containing protein
MPHCSPRPRPSRLPALLLAVVLLATGCGDGGSPTDTTPPPPPPVQVSLTPTSASLDQGATASFTASVTNAQNTAVSWATTGGTLSGQGNTVTLTAPETAGQVTVTATSVADGTRSASATVTVAAVAVSLTAPEAPILRHGTATLTAAVSGTVTTGVTWEATCEGVDAEGATATWAAPGTPESCQVTATSTADPSRSASAELAVDPAFVVNAAADEDDGRCDPDHCSLREAVILGLAELEEGAEELQIRFASSLEGATLTLASTLPTLRGRISIVGPGPEALTIDANAGNDGDRRVFSIVEGDVLLEGMTLTGGDTENLPPALRRGGGVSAAVGSEVRLRNMVVQGNRSRASGGGVSAVTGSILYIQDSRILENHASSGGGLVLSEATLILEDSEVRGNTTSDVAGGIRADESEVTIRGSQVADNVSNSAGGGIYLAASSTATIEETVLEGNRSVASVGGGVALLTQSTAAVEGVTLRENRSALGGGGVYVSASILNMEGSTLTGNESENNAGGGLHFTGAQGSIAGSRFEGNVARGSGSGGGGAAIVFSSSVTMEAVEVVENEAPAGSGGGVLVGSASEVTWSGGLVRGNRAETLAGGISIGFSQVTLQDLDVAENEAGTFGGGVSATGPGPVLLERMTLRGNTAGNGGGGLSLQVTEGGAVVRNVTISGNTAQNGAAARIGNAALLEHVTMVGNLSSPIEPTWGGGLFLFGSSASQLRLRHVLMAGNLTDGEPRGCTVLPGGASFVSEGGNVVEDTACAEWLSHGSDRVGVDPGVEAALGDHGGVTPTHALVEGSVAIGAGDTSTCAETDQRGFLRSEGCDAGAMQANGTAPAPGLRLSTLRR